MGWILWGCTLGNKSKIIFQVKFETVTSTTLSMNKASLNLPRKMQPLAAVKRKVKVRKKKKKKIQKLLHLHQKGLSTD